MPLRSRYTNCAAALDWNFSPTRPIICAKCRYEGEPMRSCLLYLIGVPIPIIILLWLITGHA